MTSVGDVLVLDGDDDCFGQVQAQLLRLGFSVSRARSFEAARDAVAEGRWVTMFTSLQHPEGNPLSALSTFADGRPLPPVVVYSSIIRRRDLIRAIQVPVCDFLEFPVRLGGLACALERAAGSAGITPRSRAYQPDHIARSVRQAAAIISGVPQAKRVAIATLASRPTLRAAWEHLIVEMSLPPIGDLADGSAELPSFRLAGAGICAAMVAECLRLDGAWRVQAEAATFHAVKRAVCAGTLALERGLDPADAHVASILRSVGECVLLLQSAVRQADRDPHPDTLARLAAVGPRTSGPLLRSWGMTAALLQRFAVPSEDGSVDEAEFEGFFALLDERVSTVGLQSGVGGAEQG